MAYSHVPVLLNEFMELLQPAPGQRVVDCTLGGGGYSMALLGRIQPGGSLLAIDLDQAAIENFSKKLKSQALKKSVTIAHGNFRDLDKIVRSHHFDGLDGIVADLGLSSFELDQSGRGITFQKKEVLDMRFDQAAKSETAAFMLNNYSEQQLTEIFTKYGEEPFSRLIVKGILRSRAEKEIKYTTELLEIITESVPRRFTHKAKDSARRVFQALRIAVNGELENLEQMLPKALELLKSGGRLAVVSFHSLEDRMVKHFFQEASRGCICPPDFPECRCGRSPAAKTLTRKPVTASRKELLDNPRSKPAKLRVLQKI